MRAIDILKEYDLIGTPSPTIRDIFKKYPNIPQQDLMDQLTMGIKEELEHTGDEAVAREIALDHLKEDPYYYTKLKNAMSADDDK